MRSGDALAEPLVKALAKREGEYRAAIDRLRDHVENDPGAYDAAVSLREAVALVGCLRRIVPHIDVRDLHATFGAPGDYGYETPIGAALFKVYSGERK